MPTGNDSEFWKRKLAAYLHDPPEKAYDYSPEHGKRAQHYAERLCINLANWQEKIADHTAAAADRFIFPSTRRKEGDKWVDTGVPGLGGGLQFVHPLSGHLVAASDDFPSEDEALGLCRDGLPDFAKVTDEEIRFRLVWRLWRQFTLELPEAKKHALGLACLPADTRIPDGTIWHHDSIVSALESARDKKGRFAPAFLLFQLGPVQDFIAQARSTRDLWSGSYLLSWMMAHVIKSVTDRLGPDVVIFPSLRGQPLFDWLEEDRLKQAFHASVEGGASKNFWEAAGYASSSGQELALTPNLPNRFLAIVPADFDPSTLHSVLDPDKPDSEWSRIAQACWDFLSAEPLPGAAQNLWCEQLRRFWQPTWQLWPWQDITRSLELFAQIPLGKDSILHLGRQVALAIPYGHKDTRCYTPNLNEIASKGWAWSAHYQLLQHRLDARRQTRDFIAWHTTAPAHKDNLSGKEEAIATREWLERAGKKDQLRHLFRHNEELGAVNLIKRVWHKAYLEKLSSFRPELADLRRVRESFDSVPAVAARPFAEWLLSQTASGPLRDPFLAFMQAASDARHNFPDAIARWENNEEHWFRFTDASVFHLDTWERAIQDTPDESARQLLSKARDALARLLKASPAQPGKYYAVLALDGDQIGKWLSGERTPKIKEVITDKTSDYFKDMAGKMTVEEQRQFAERLQQIHKNGHTRKPVDWQGSWPHTNTEDSIRIWLDSPRPLSPSYHLQFSEALANFGLYCARRIVEAHHGQLIYSGGDDVLAMLPAAEAVACAQGLRLAFQGRSQELVQHADGCYAHLFEDGVPEGFVQLKDGDWNRGCRRPVEPSWPLLMPGPRMTVSVGLAIGHIKEPLQDMIREAQAAEKRAKADPEKEIYDRSDADPAKHGLRWKHQEGWGRDALAVTLFKRSGETIRWGARFNSAAFQLLELFQKHYRPPLENPKLEMPISSKFPYRVAELLGKFGQQATVTSELAEIGQAEFAWITQQQIRQSGPIQSEQQLHQLRDLLRQNATAYLHELRDFAWDRPTPNGGKERTQAARPLSEFINLFALEAFIA